MKAPEDKPHIVAYSTERWHNHGGTETAFAFFETAEKAIAYAESWKGSTGKSWGHTYLGHTDEYRHRKFCEIVGSKFLPQFKELQELDEGIHKRYEMRVLFDAIFRWYERLIIDKEIYR